MPRGCALMSNSNDQLAAGMPHGCAFISERALIYAAKLSRDDHAFITTRADSIGELEDG